MLILLIENAMPGSLQKGYETGWPPIARALVPILFDATGGRPVRHYNDAKGVEKGWGLEFFRDFACLVDRALPKPLRRKHPFEISHYARIWRAAYREWKAEREALERANHLSAKDR